jgi:lipopolysaccharide/colanic/teichoic acid biosynthesis glycosyltransferase
LLVLVILFPLISIIGVLIIIDSKGGVIYYQERVGRNLKPFMLYKFRTMKQDSIGLKITVGKDSRITRIGHGLRKYKLDELPQLINIIKGDMSVVGPRPETPNYVALYTIKQQRVLDVRPGLTDYASLEFIDENKVLSAYDDPEKAYIEKIMPVKLGLNLKYIKENSFSVDLKIIFKTIFKIFN